MKIKSLIAAGIVATVLTSPAFAIDLPDGSKEHPLRVLMIPADTGTDDITKDYGPVFNGITKHYGIHFDIKAGSSYAAVIEGMCNNQADVAWYGASSYGEANKKCGVDLLAVDVKKGESVYYSGIFTRKGNGIKTLKDLRGKRIAFGSTSSTSSFNFPVAMLIAAGVDPVKDFKKIIIAGSHSASLAALAEGRVDAAAASYNSFGKAVKKGALDAKKFRPLVKSQPIPNPPLAMNKNLDPKIKAMLRKAFNNIHTLISADKIRGYGGKKVDRYDANFDERKIFAALSKLGAVTKEVKVGMIDKAGQR